MILVYYIKNIQISWEKFNDEGDPVKPMGNVEALRTTHQ